MIDNDMTNIVERYQQRFAKFGVSPKTLGWDKNRAKLRFEILAAQWNLNYASILDFGCGFGDFYSFLRNKEVEGLEYYGIDINPSFIKVAQTQFPEGSFQTRNILETEIRRKFDYIFASGVFNDKMNDNKAFIEKVFEKFNEYARKGFAVNFLSDKVEYRYDHAFYTDPAFALNLGYRYSNNIVLRNDYMPFEFTIFVNKATKYYPAQAVYEEFLQYL